MVAVLDAPSNIEYALRYAGMGWAVLPLHYIKNGRCSCGASPCGSGNRSAGKHPLSDMVRNGVHDASKDATKIREWWARVPGANIGIATGEPSGFDVLDVDPRNGSEDTLTEVERTHGKLPGTATQLTGGGGYHYLFKHAGARLRSPGRGLDVKSTGGYIIAEPSNHASGGSYQWEGSADPTDGAEMVDAPAWLLEPDRKKGPTLASEGAGYLDPQRIEDLRAALAHLDAAHYETWIGVGQALHSTAAPESFELWDTWSQSADNYDGSTDRKWRTFKIGRGLHVESIFVWARDAGWDGESPRAEVPVPLASVKLRPVITDGVGTPSRLLTIPGVLGDVVDYANRTAPQPQPQFAVQAALAFGATVMGRHLRTTQNNFPSLFFICVGKSSGGKEHTRKVIELCLDACGLSRLIGPTNYASGPAVVSELLRKPSHCAIVDEFGRVLSTASAEGNYHRQDALTSLMSVWGQLDGVVRAAAYSTMSMPKRDSDEMGERMVRHPALSLVGMSTPKSFYNALNEAAIESGFLGRFIIVESHLPRRVPARVHDVTVPGSIAQWAEAIRSGEGNLAGVDLGPDQAPLPRVVDFTADAWKLFDAYGAKCVAAMEELEEHGWAELQGRSREKAMRLALIVAGSCNPMRPVIEADHASWAIEFTDYYTTQTINAVRTHLHGSKFGALYQHVVERIQAGGTQGRTLRELAKFSAQFRGLDPRTRKQVLEALKADGAASEVTFPRPPGARGRTRVAWVATDPEQDDD